MFYFFLIHNGLITSLNASLQNHVCCKAKIKLRDVYIKRIILSPNLSPVFLSSGNVIFCSTKPLSFSLCQQQNNNLPPRMDKNEEVEWTGPCASMFKPPNTRYLHTNDTGWKRGMKACAEKICNLFASLFWTVFHELQYSVFTCMVLFHRFRKI